MKLGDCVEVVKRFHNIKDFSADNQKRIEGYERMLTDLTEAFGDEETMKEEREDLWMIYDAIRYEKEELENALVRN